MSPTVERELADTVIEAARENTTKPKPEPEPDPKERPPESVGDFRHNLLRMADLADATVRDAQQARAESANLRARHEQEVKAHARTMEILRAAEATNVELRQQLANWRENNARLRAHIETMGNNLLSATRIPDAKAAASDT